MSLRLSCPLSCNWWDGHLLWLRLRELLVRLHQPHQRLARWLTGQSDIISCHRLLSGGAQIEEIRSSALTGLILVDVWGKADLSRWSVRR